jgi:superfamily II DNA or RNA helicase
MDIYNGLKENLNNLIEIKNEFGILTDSILKIFKYPKDINDLIIEDIKMVMLIIDFQYNDTIMNIKADKLIEDIIINRKIIYNKTNDKKEKYIRFTNIIIDYLLGTNFYFEIYMVNKYIKKSINDKEVFDDNLIIDETTSNEITSEEIDSDEEIYSEENPDGLDDILTNKQLEKFEWRQNQLEGLENQEKQGYRDGIHCQIMGAGKSYMILNTIQRIKNLKLYKNIYILTTYRKEILNTMFLFPIEKNNKKALEIEQKEMFNSWKNNGIINMDEFIIYDAVNKGTQKDIDKLCISKKNIILVINNTYFTRIDFSKIIKNVNCLIIDECHSVSTGTKNKFCKQVLKFKYKCPIIGYSATPLREADKSRENLLKIFGENNKLNIISNYSLFDAIKDDKVLPFKYHLIETPSQKELIKVFEQQIIFGIRNELPFRKFIGWVKDKNELEKWSNEIKNRYEELFYRKDKYGNFVLDEDGKKISNIYVSSSFNRNDAFINFNSDLNEFQKLENDAFLLCIHKCKEGYDDKKLDCGIQLSIIQKRATEVFLQMFGRIMRTCEGKEIATIIEFYTSDSDKKIEDLTIEKILKYYILLLNLTDNDMEKEKQKEYINLYRKTEFLEKENEIVIKIDDKKKHNCRIVLSEKIVDWSAFKDKLKEQVYTETKYDKKQEYWDDIENNKKYKFNTDKEYLKRCDSLKLKKNPKEYYGEVWGNWYEYLGIDTSCYPNYNQWVSIIEKNKIDTPDKYEKACYKLKLPLMPEELYRGFNNLYTEIKKIFEVEIL